MRWIHRAALLVLIAGFFAGCARGGPGLSALPSGDHALQPQLNGGGPGFTQPTLYVSGQGAVYAYDLTSTPSPNASPVSRTTGYYYQSGSVSTSIAGIATNSAGDLVVAQNVGAASGDSSCQLVFIPARTPTSAAQANTAPCSPGDQPANSGSAVGVTFTGPPTGAAAGLGATSDDIDVLMHYVKSSVPPRDGCTLLNQTQYEVDRYQVSGGSIVPRSCAVLGHANSAIYAAIAGSTNGAFFVDSNAGSSGTLERYNSLSGGPSNVGSLPGTAGPMAVAVNYATNVGYRVIASTTGGSTTIYSFKTSGSGFTFNHALGTFSNQVGALAVDNNGTIFVGVNQPNGVTKVKVYGPAKTEATNPDYILNNPVRRPNPAASPVARITGMAISQANAAAPSPGPTPPVVYNSIPGGALSGDFTSVAFQGGHTLEFGDGVNLTQTGNLHSVSWILSSGACQTHHSGACFTSPGATFALPITTNVYALTNSGSHVGTLLATQTKTFDIPYRPSNDPSRCASPDLSLDPVSGKCLQGIGVRIDYVFGGSIPLPAQAIFTVTFNTTSFGYSPYGTSTACFTTTGCGYDSLNVSASTLGGPVGSPYDVNSTFLAVGTDGYQGGACNPNPSYPPGQLNLDNGCWGSTAVFPAGLHPELQVTTQ